MLVECAVWVMGGMCSHLYLGIVCLRDLYIDTVVQLLVECAVNYDGGMCSLSYGWNVQSAMLVCAVGYVGGVVACKIIVIAPVPIPFLWSFDFRLQTWIWDLE